MEHGYHRVQVCERRNRAVVRGVRVLQVDRDHVRRRRHQGELAQGHGERVGFIRNHRGKVCACVHRDG